MTASVARFIESFIPENYNLFLDINRSEKTFTGMLPLLVKPLDNHIISSTKKTLPLIQFSWIMNP